MPSTSRHRDHDDPRASNWEKYFSDVQNERWLVAKALLELDAHRTVQRDAARWITNSQREGHLTGSSDWIWDLELDWEAWVLDVDDCGRGWSGSEYRLFEVVAGLVVGRPFDMVGVLDRLGSWRVDAWRILAQWGTR